MKRERMSLNSFPAAAYLLLLASLPGHVSHVGAEETDLLNIVKQKDIGPSITYTVSFTMHKPARVHDPNQGMVFMDCRAAQNAIGTRATKITYYYDKDPVFVRPGSGIYGDIDYDDGRLIVWRKTRKYAVSSRERNTSIYTLKCLEVDPNDQVRVVGTNTLVHHMPITSDGSPALRHFQLSVGWGYSKHLVRSVSTQPVNDLVKMMVEGSQGAGSEEGIWELVVDPNSDHMIREASFRRKGMDEPVTASKNRGILATDNIRIARYGTLELGGEPVEALGRGQ